MVISYRAEAWQHANSIYIFCGCSSFFKLDNVKGKGKGKAIPLQGWTGPKGSRRLRLPDFKTIGK
jgi:hypothetical protein